ncbi:uncharacterized protein [Cardiocondyla obscurior]|uniref:uncharacterized protein n=1 Tax=Cardiocondyla obscurior TaxID=286306 RepID=UPI0039657A6C
MRLSIQREKHFNPLCLPRAEFPLKSKSVWTLISLAFYEIGDKNRVTAGISQLLTDLRFVSKEPVLGASSETFVSTVTENRAHANHIESNDYNFSSLEEKDNDNNLNLPSLQQNIISTFKFLQTQISFLLSSLYANVLIPRNIVQLIVDELHNIFLIDLEEGIFVRLKEILPLDVYNELVSYVKPSDLFISNSLENFVSDFRRLRYYKELGTLFQATEVTVGQKLQGKRTTFRQLTVFTKCTMQVVDESGIENIVQDSIWKLTKKKFENEIGLHFPIIVYWDDFEIGNPLGAQAGVYKLGAVYVSLPFLPLHFVNNFLSIFLLGLFHLSDIVKFGNAVIFSKIIDCLNNLSKNGITVETDAYNGVIKFYLGAFVGDNLALFGALGFTESFSSKYPCRICRVDKDGLQNLMREDINLLRNMDSYASDVEICDLFKTGIKEKCCWLEVEGFNFFENVSTDILHDWFQGVCQYAIQFVLFSLIKTYKLIPLSLLKIKLSTFDFGSDNISKPSNTISIDGHQVKYKTSSSQMFTLVRYFALIVGLYIPENHSVWNFFLLLRRITDRLINRRVYFDSCDALAYDLEEFNRQYLKLFNNTLKPKFHFMIHYPRLMKMFVLSHSCRHSDLK